MKVNLLLRKCHGLRQLCHGNRNLAVALAVFSVMPLIFSSVLGGWLLNYRELVSDWIVTAGALPILAFAVTMALGLTPTTFVALVCGFFVGFEGTGYLVLAYVLASGAGYGLGQWLDGGRFMHSLEHYPLAEKVAADLGHRPVMMLILVRLSPALPFCLMNLLMAALRVRFDLYLLAGAIGMLPRTLLSLWIGSQSRDLVELLQSGGGTQETVAVIVGSMVTVVLFVWLVMRRIKHLGRT